MQRVKHIISLAYTPPHLFSSSPSILTTTRKNDSLIMWPARVFVVAVVIVMLVYCLTLCRAWLCRAGPLLPHFPCQLKGRRRRGVARQVTSAQESARTYLFTYQVRGLFSATARSNNNRSWQPLYALSPPLLPPPLDQTKKKINMKMKTLPKGLFCLRKASTRHSYGPQSERIERQLGGNREGTGARKREKEGEKATVRNG